MKITQQCGNSSLEFRVFWRYIAQQLGDSRLRINSKAKSIHDFIDLDNDAKEYLRESIKESYKRCGCDHLGSKLCVNIVLDILGETAYQLRSSHRDDLFDIELLEEIAWHINDRYRHYLSIQSIGQTKPNTNRVISFPNYKIRIANARL